MKYAITLVSLPTMSEVIHYTACPICNSKNIAFALEAEDYTVSHKKFPIWKCEDCTGCFTQDVPDLEHIGPYYNAEAYVSHSDTKKGIINRLYHSIRKITLKQKRNLVQEESKLKSGKLLDIGAGTGAFAHQMNISGWTVTGLEPDEIARQNALKLHGLNLLPSDQLFSFPTESFDVVTMWHVLEHVHSLHEYMDAIKKILRPNGVAMIAVPNYTSYDAQHYGVYWAAWDVPRHLYHFSPKSMSTLAEEHGMEVVHHIPMIFDSYYVSMLSEKYKNGKYKNLSAFINGNESNTKAQRDPKKFSSVIYVIKKK
ncbi:class I SAM-dependent methyltransferase [Rhizosphaericola mali]|nr:class I SAM-dependent methyltransferase [Rhizosphaericola mali]